MMTTDPTRPADGDVLSGMAAIAKALGVPRRQAYHWSYTAGLPTFTIGRTVCAKRSRLHEWIAAKEAAAQQPAAAD